MLLHNYSELSLKKYKRFENLTPFWTAVTEAQKSVLLNFPLHFYFYFEFSSFRILSLSPLNVTKESHRDLYGFRKKSHCAGFTQFFSNKSVTILFKTKTYSLHEGYKSWIPPRAALTLNKSQTKGSPTHPRAHPQHRELHKLQISQSPESFFPCSPQTNQNISSICSSFWKYACIGCGWIFTL